MRPHGALKPPRLLLAWLGAAMLLGITAAPASAATPLYPTQSVGDRGTDVWALQGLLQARGYAISPDGIFGTSTRLAVQARQRDAGLPANGIVDDWTWKYLYLRSIPGSHGPAVLALQRELRVKRHLSVPMDGVFGGTTWAALRTFQGHAGVPVTGKLDPLSWRLLVSHFELPHFSAVALCDYSVGNGTANWGTAAAMAEVTAAARTVVAAGHGRVAVGDVGLQHGGRIAGHDTHRVGLDVDVRLIRKDHGQCTRPSNYRSSTYDRAATRAFILAIRATAPGHVKLIYFNDPVLIQQGLTTHFPGHDDHLHIRYCEKTHPDRRYDC